MNDLMSELLGGKGRHQLLNSLLAPQVEEFKAKYGGCPTDQQCSEFLKKVKETPPISTLMERWGDPDQSPEFVAKMMKKMNACTAHFEDNYPNDPEVQIQAAVLKTIAMQWLSGFVGPQ